MAASMPDVAARLRALRKQRGITLEVLAGLSGVSISYLSMVENGNRTLNTYSTIVGIASALDVPPAELAPGMPGGLAASGAALGLVPSEVGRQPLPLLPGWARRLTELRRARVWSPADLACELKKIRADLPSVKSLRHMIQMDWESGRHRPGPRYRLLLAAVYDADEQDIFGDGELVADALDADGLHITAERLTIASPAHLQEILIHLREQWHALVKTDNLLGPRFALAGVLNQISVVEALRSILRDEQRIEVARLGAKYAESAAWLYEDTDNMTQARSWTSQAMEWAYEGNDERMLAWTIFRRAQQAAAIPDPAQTIGLAQAARRNEEKLATPTRAAIRVQEAYGHALDGNDQAAQRLLDEAHTWAAGDTVGDAREGHGSYCTPGYIEIQRGHCWLATGQPKKAISLYEDSLRTLPTVYQRNRAATLTRLAVAYAADSQPEQAANTAHAALPVARSAGSNRIVGEIKNVGTELIPYRALPAVAALLDELEAEDH
jgi:transcriptional regulator with XRE-family HTH domain